MEPFVEFEFSGARSEFRAPEETWQVLLWIEADFRVVLPEGVLLSETHWCIFELALAIADWLKSGFLAGSDFVYTSMDDADEGLLTFVLVAEDQWVVGSVWQAFNSNTRLSSAKLREACLSFLSRVRASVSELVEPAVRGYVIESCT